MCVSTPPGLGALKLINLSVEMGLGPNDAISIGDTALSDMLAQMDCVTVVVTPGALTSEQDLWQSDLVVNALGDGQQVNPRLLGMLNGEE